MGKEGENSCCKGTVGSYEGRECFHVLSPMGPLKEVKNKKRVNTEGRKGWEEGRRGPKKNGG